MSTYLIKSISTSSAGTFVQLRKPLWAEIELPDVLIIHDRTNNGITQDDFIWEYETKQKMTTKKVPEWNWLNPYLKVAQTHRKLLTQQNIAAEEGECETSEKISETCREFHFLRTAFKPALTLGMRHNHLITDSATTSVDPRKCDEASAEISIPIGADTVQAKIFTGTLPDYFLELAGVPERSTAGISYEWFRDELKCVPLSVMFTLIPCPIIQHFDIALTQ